MSTRLHIVVSEGLVARIDAARGPGQPRADFIRRAVERALGEPPGGKGRVETAERAESALPPAPAEQSENQYVSVYDHDENAELPEAGEFARGPKFGTFPVQPERRVAPLRPVSPGVPSPRPYVKPFQRGDK